MGCINGSIDELIASVEQRAAPCAQRVKQRPGGVEWGWVKKQKRAGADG